MLFFALLFVLECCFYLRFVIITLIVTRHYYHGISKQMGMSINYGVHNSYRQNWNIGYLMIMVDAH